MHLTTSFVKRSSLALVLVAALAGTAGAAPHWGGLEANECTAIGFRQHSAILWDIPWWTNWTEACYSTVHPDTGRTPDRCEQAGFMYGEWDLEDSSCPHWSYDYGNWLNGCIPNVPQGTFREAHILWDIPWGMDWEDTCNSTPATIDGHFFSAPEYCTSCGFNICGVFLVPNTSCPSCGNGVCSGGETCGGCPSDCGPCPVCGDGACTGNETPMSCSDDCGACGNGFCGVGESCSTCQIDCGACAQTCSGSPAGPGAAYFSIGVQNPINHCAVSTNLVFANSLTEAYNCQATAHPGYTILTNPPTLTQYWYSNPFDIPCIEILVPAFTPSDAEYCANFYGYQFTGRCD